MNKKQLAIELSRLHGFKDYNACFEQYASGSEIAAEVLWLAYLNKDIKDKVVADLGCGPGIFGVGALMLGARKVYFLDADKNVLEIAKKNAKKGEFILADVAEFNKKVDTVIMNPPFGVQRRKADKRFLEVAMSCSKKIYSLHKIESVKFIEALCRDNGWRIKDILRLDFILGKTMEFHREREHLVRVGCWVLERFKNR